MNPISKAADLENRIRQLEEEAEGNRALVSRLEVRDTLTRILSDSASPADAAPRVLRAMGTLLNWQAGLFWMPDSTSSVLRCVSEWSDQSLPDFLAASEQRALPLGVGLPGRVWLNREPGWLADIEKDDNFPRIAAASKNGLRSGFAFPILAGESIVGVIEFFSTAHREADPALLEMSVIIGHQIGLFLQRARAEAQLRRQVRMASLRGDITTALAHSSDLRNALTRCTDAVVAHADAAFARIWTLNPGETVLELQASSGLYTHLDGAHSRIRIGAFKIGWIAEKREPHLTNSVPDDPRVTDQDWARREGMQAFAGYPLLVEDRLMGVLAMFSRRRLEQVELDELAPISDAIAQFLDRRRADEGLRRSEALKSAILETAFDAIVAMNQNGRVVEFNKAAEAMFGYTRTEAIGKTIADLMVPPQLRESHWMGLARYLNTGEARILGRRIEIVAMRRGGAEFPVELAVNRIPGEGPAMFTAYIRDLSAAKNA